MPGATTVAGMRPYEMGNPEIDAKIRELVDAAGAATTPS